MLQTCRVLQSFDSFHVGSLEICIFSDQTAAEFGLAEKEEWVLLLQQFSHVETLRIGGNVVGRTFFAILQDDRFHSHGADRLLPALNKLVLTVRFIATYLGRLPTAPSAKTTWQHYMRL